MGMIRKETLKDKNKTNADFWENTWQQIPLGKYHGIEKYLAINKKLDNLFKNYLHKGHRKILEIGCAKGKQLIYFAREFGYDVYGIDYSEKGVELAQQNLRIAGVEGTIVCENVFQTSFNEESFDIVYSMGLIEHFQNPAEIIDVHTKLLKRGGTTIITIPNLNRSLYLTIIRLLGKEKEISKTHNLSIMDKKVLNKLLQDSRLKILTLNYFGPVDLTITFSGIKNRPILYLMHLLNQIVGYVTFFMPHSKYFSPYIVLVAQKVV